MRVLTVCAAFAAGASAFRTVPSMSTGMDRRQALLSLGAPVAAGAAVAVAGVAPAFAEDFSMEDVPISTSRLGGVLEQYSDLQRGFKMMTPYSWNKFENGEGYDVRWVDLVNNKENVLLRSSPVKSDSTLEAIGSPDKVRA